MRRAAMLAVLVLCGLLSGCEAVRVMPTFQRDVDSGVARGPVHLLALPDAVGPARERARNPPPPEAVPLEALLQAALLECRTPGDIEIRGFGATTLLLGTIAQLGVTWVTDMLTARADEVRERASAAYGAEIVMTGAQLRRTRCIVFQRELPGHPPGTYRADADAGLVAVFRVKAYTSALVEPRPAAVGPKGVMVTPPPVIRQDPSAIQLEPIYLRVNRSIAWTAPHCPPGEGEAALGPHSGGAAPAPAAAAGAGVAAAVPRSPCVDLGFSFAVKPIVREAGRYIVGTPLTAALQVDGVRLGRTLVAACETGTPAAANGCRDVDLMGRQNTGLIPLPPDDDLPLTLAVAVGEVGRVGLRVDRAKAQLDALGAALGPLAKDLVTEIRKK